MMSVSRRRALLLAASATMAPVLPPVLSRTAFGSDFAAQARQFIERAAGAARSEAAAVKAAGDARVRFGALFAQSFDLEALARNVLGSRWNGLGAAQQEAFRAAFGAYVVKSYADRFYTYAGQPMSVISADPAAGGEVLVRTRVQMPGGGAQTPVDWQVSQTAQGARISDVVIDGVSLTRTQRDEFASVIRANGGDVGKLTAMLEQRAR